VRGGEPSSFALDAFRAERDQAVTIDITRVWLRLLERGIVVIDHSDPRHAVGSKPENLTPVDHKVTRASRAERFGHRGGILWLTGLSGAGKSTLAMAVEQHLFRRGYAVYVLDGDNVRSGLNANLSFSPEDRVENIRRVGEVAALFADAGFLCITAFISPYRADRARARQAGGEAFHEIYVRADLETCERRDPKGLYRRARAGEIADFTGVSAASRSASWSNPSQRSFWIRRRRRKSSSVEARSLVPPSMVVASRGVTSAL